MIQYVILAEHSVIDYIKSLVLKIDAIYVAQQGVVNSIVKLVKITNQFRIPTSLC